VKLLIIYVRFNLNCTDRLLMVNDSNIGSVHTASEKFENAALFLPLGIPSTRSFSTTLLKPEEFENSGFSFSCGGKIF